MKILVGMWHPAHFHTFRNVIKNLQKKGHQFKILAIDKDIVKELLDLYSFDYEIIGESPGDLLIKKGLELIKLQSRILKIAHSFEPDLMLSRSISPLLPFKKMHDVPLIIFDDNDNVSSSISKFLYADYIFTPNGCKSSKNCEMHIRLDTYKELAYAHPNNFEPKRKILDKFGISKNEPYSLIRFVGWEAWHDEGRYGFNIKDKKSLVNELSKYGEVYISSEKELPEELQEYRLDIPSDKIHHLLYYADLFVGDSQTMTTEAAVLGTPAIRCNSFVGEDDMNNFIELEEKYGLIYNYQEPEKAIRKAVELIQQPNLKEKWHKKREKLLEDKIDLSAFLTWFIDNYPESVNQLEENKDIIWEVGQ